MDEQQVRGWLQSAYKIAELSNDPRTKNGAILVWSDGENLLSGWNHRLPSSDDAPEAKYVYTEHAERDVIYKAIRLGFPSTRGATLVCPWAACPECARAIILAGIGMVYVHKQALDRTPERWREQVTLGLELLEHNEIRVIPYDGKVFPKDDPFEALFDGQKWRP